MHFKASIVIPVWNRLDALGNCLASLAEHTPDTQFVLVDLGSERETERLLEQFAEALEERVLLMHEPLNQGKTAAINRGIASATGEIVVVLSPMTIVTANWLLPICQIIDEFSDIGIVCPRFIPWSPRKKNKASDSVCTQSETIRGSFYCQAMPRQLITQIGTFDNNLDGSTRCLDDFSRRAWRAGFRTVQTAKSTVYTSPEQLFGSTERRARIDEESLQRSIERWGETTTFCLCLNDLEPWWLTILNGARQGNHYIILLPAAVHRQCMVNGRTYHHSSVTFVALPRLFPERRGRNILNRLISENPELQLVTDAAVAYLPENRVALSIDSLTATIVDHELKYYGHRTEQE